MFISSKKDMTAELGKKSHSGTLVGYILGFIVLFNTGFQPIINNGRPGDLGALLFTFITVLVEFGCITPVLLVENYLNDKKVQHFPISMDTWKSYWKRFVGIGIIFAVSTYLVILGYSNTDNISGSVAVRLQPVSMMIIGYFFLNEKITKSQMVFTAVMLLSIYHVSTRGTWLLNEFSFGIVFLLIAPVLWNIGHTIVKPLLEKGIVTSPQVVFLRTGISSIILGTFYVIVDGGRTAWQITSPVYFIFMFLMGINYTMQHYFMYKGFKHLDLSIFTAIIIPSPIVTAIFATLFLNDSFEPYHLIGMIGAFIGLYGLLYSKLKAKKKDNTRHN
ncbi:MAG: DMT family transporter [Candidatus Hodarchaeota archaeon]